jgi:hypothetical protein
MNVHERVMSALASLPQPATPAQIQAEARGCSYALVHNTLSELVRSGKILESRNAVDKRVFSVKG